MPGCELGLALRDPLRALLERGTLGSDSAGILADLFRALDEAAFPRLQLFCSGAGSGLSPSDFVEGAAQPLFRGCDRVFALDEHRAPLLQHSNEVLCTSFLLLDQGELLDDECLELVGEAAFVLMQLLAGRRKLPVPGADLSSLITELSLAFDQLGERRFAAFEGLELLLKRFEIGRRPELGFRRSSRHAAILLRFSRS